MMEDDLNFDVVDGVLIRKEITEKNNRHKKYNKQNSYAEPSKDNLSALVYQSSASFSSSRWACIFVDVEVLMDDSQFEEVAYIKTCVRESPVKQVSESSDKRNTSPSNH